MPPRTKPFPGSRAVLSLGLILVSTIYAAMQQWRFTDTAAQTSAQSFKAANDRLLQTLSDLQKAPAAQTPAQNAGAGPGPGPTAGAGAGSGMGMMGNGQMGSPMHTGFTDGSYVGSAADAYYGLVQVKAVIQSGKITDVQFLQYPNDRNTSRYINSKAMPLLTQEAIQAQSAQVSGVSGATETSLAFRQSLASALAQAK